MRTEYRLRHEWANGVTWDEVLSERKYGASSVVLFGAQHVMRCEGSSAIVVEQWRVPEDSDRRAAIDSARHRLATLRERAETWSTSRNEVARPLDRVIADLERAAVERRVGEPRRIALAETDGGK